MPGIKHLIQCHCILPQYRKMNDPLFHKFVVYSKYDDYGSIEPKIAKCNNCDVYHNVVEICKSEFLEDYDDTGFIIGIDDIEEQLPEKLCRILRKNNCDLSTWENILDMYESSVFDVPVVIARKTLKDITHIKSLKLTGKDSIKIENNTIDNTVDNINEIRKN